MAGEKRSQDQDEVSFARTVLVDIEGTTTSISFVKVNGGGAPQMRRKRSATARTRPHEIGPRRPDFISHRAVFQGERLLADFLPERSVPRAADGDDVFRL